MIKNRTDYNFFNYIYMSTMGEVEQQAADIMRAFEIGIQTAKEAMIIAGFTEEDAYDWIVRNQKYAGTTRRPAMNKWAHREGAQKPGKRQGIGQERMYAQFNESEVVERYMPTDFRHASTGRLGPDITAEAARAVERRTTDDARRSVTEDNARPSPLYNTMIQSLWTTGTIPINMGDYVGANVTYRMDPVDGTS